MAEGATTRDRPLRYFDSDDGTSSNDSDTSFLNDDTDSDDDDDTRVVRGASPWWPDHVSGLAVLVGIVMALRFNPEWWA
jgi:hypothetical protein